MVSRPAKCGTESLVSCFVCLPVDVDPARDLVTLGCLENIEVSTVWQFLPIATLAIPLVNIVRIVVNIGTVTVEDADLPNIEGT